MDPSDISYFARTNHRAQGLRFGIKQEDRLSHIYIIGKTGAGKSTLIETLARQDLAARRGFALIDPHGDLVKPLSAADPEAALVARSMVWSALEALPPRRRAMLVMYELEGTTIPAIAKLLGVAPVTVRWHLARGRREMAARLKGKQGDQ